MKAIKYFIFFTGIFFSHPCNALSFKSKLPSFTTGSFQKTQPDNFFISNDIQNPAIFFEEDLLDDDDDEDKIALIKKKAFFEFSACCYSNQNTLNIFYNKWDEQFFRCPHISHIPLFNFISLRVFRL